MGDTPPRSSASFVSLSPDTLLLDRVESPPDHDYDAVVAPKRIGGTNVPHAL